MLANGLGEPKIWFTVLENSVAALVNELAEATNRLVTLAIWYTGLAMPVAWLAI